MSTGRPRSTILSSPRSWGCFLSIQRQGRTGWVFPTLVGVFPSSAKPLLCSVCLPHARGGVSRPCSLFPSRASSSPRSWGCFCLRADLRALYLVFPTLVGVFHSSRTTRTFRRRLPHARGGVSAHFYRPAFTVESSPRSWGCFRPTLHCRTWDCVFPTLVGVFPDTFSTAARQSESSPRSWGCFPHIRIPARRAKVFPTLVGVFLRYCCSGVLTKGLPHARGGVSIVQSLLSFAMESSPRSWGCFLALDAQLHGLVVFPTLVGVFPTAAPARRRRPGLPHARGGVSRRVKEDYYQRESSPRSWGCFRRGSHRSAPRPVFPTLVGVFLSSSAPSR